MKFLDYTTIDYDDDENKTEEDNELRLRLINDFVRKNKNKVNEIVAAINSGDIKLAHRLAHTLKSTAGLLEMVSLQFAARDVEHNLTNEENKVTQLHLNTLERELNSALSEVLPLVTAPENSTEGKSLAPLSPAEKQELLKKLRALLKSGNMECLNLIDDLKRVSGTEEVINQMEDLEFTNALEVLNEKIDEFLS